MFPQDFAPASAWSVGAGELLSSRLRAHPDEAGWWSWLVVDRGSRHAIGSLALGGRPNANGIVDLTVLDSAGLDRAVTAEAARAFIDWVFTRSQAGVVRAAVPEVDVVSLDGLLDAGMREVDRRLERWNAHFVGFWIVLEARQADVTPPLR